MREGAAKLIILLNNGDGSYPFSSFYFLPGSYSFVFSLWCSHTSLFLKKNLELSSRETPCTCCCACCCWLCRVSRGCMVMAMMGRYVDDMRSQPAGYYVGSRYMLTHTPVCTRTPLLYFFSILLLFSASLRTVGSKAVKSLDLLLVPVAQPAGDGRPAAQLLVLVRATYGRL